MEYLPIRINTLRADNPVNFDLFVKVGDGHVHYIKENDPLPAEQLNKLKTKGVKKLFIKPDKEPDYLAYLDEGLNKLADGSKSFSDRAAVAHDSLVTSAENIERNLDSEQGFEQAQKKFTKVIDFLMSDRVAIKTILETAGCSTDIFQHAATVSSLSLSVAMKRGIESKDLIELGIAGLVHDIGKTKINFDWMKPRKELTPAEIKTYEKHVSESMAMLSGKKMITPRILGLVASHEEIGEGKGYPERKSLSKLPAVYQIFNLCNAFDRFSLEQKLPHKQCIDPFYEAFAGYFDDEFISTLATVLT